MRLIALEEFDYNGRSYHRGDTIDDVPELHAKLLIQGQRAKDGLENGLVGKPQLETAALKAEEPEKETLPNKRGRYPRRDMRPQE